MHSRKQDLQYWCDTKTDERVSIYCSSKKGDLYEFGTNHLVSHITKIILRIIIWFKKNCSTRDAKFVFRILGESSIEMQLDIHITFIDYEKAFDRVKYEVLMNDLKMLGIEEKDLRLLNNLYKEQLAVISINGNHSD